MKTKPDEANQFKAIKESALEDIRNPRESLDYYEALKFF